MKRILIQFTGLIGLMLVLTACPYSSETPLDQKASVKIDDKLLGQWESKTSTDYIYTVSKMDDFNYKFVKKKNDSEDVTEYSGFLSMIDGVKFLNLKETGSSSTQVYYFYKLEISPSGAKVTLSPVTENITEKFASSDEMKAFFKKHMGTSFFYDKDADIYLRHE